MPAFNFVRERRRAQDATRLAPELAKLFVSSVRGSFLRPLHGAATSF
jgi:hypothetical protein